MSMEMEVRVVISTDGSRWEIQQFRNGAWVNIDRVLELRMEESVEVTPENEATTTIENI